MDRIFLIVVNSPFEIVAGNHPDFLALSETDAYI
jgi:hypothetical protein